MNEVEKNIARCYLYREGDERRKLEMTNHRLMVYHRGRKYEWPLAAIGGIDFNQRKWLFLVIFSGVFTPLTAVGLFSGFFHPLVALLLIVGGVFGFYIGWAGHPVMTVESGQHHQDIPLAGITSNLQEFVRFFNQYLSSGKPFKHAVFVILRSKLSESDFIADFNRRPDHYRLHTFDQLQQKLETDAVTGTYIVAVDPLRSGASLNYRSTERDSGLIPRFSGRVQKEAIIGIYGAGTFLDLSELN